MGMAIVIEGELLNDDVKIPRNKKLCSSKLFENKKEVRIEHQNEIYVLRITKQNKLILTK
jgi:hemin uptake protein HemP